MKIGRNTLLKKISIAIDGPAGAGKSTVAKKIAEKLGILYLDTGAMYRAVALKAIRQGINTKDVNDVSELVSDINIDVKYIENIQHEYLEGEDVTGLIRTPEVSVGASDVAAVKQVRIKMVEIQRKIASQYSVVMDGRDIGTYVLPKADLKIFLTASIEERALRRYNELIERKNFVDLCNIRKDIEYRDQNDSSRSFAPLQKAEDAVEIDTTKMTIDEVVGKILNFVKEKGYL
jgi:cytidylate kinase